MFNRAIGQYLTLNKFSVLTTPVEVHSHRDTEPACVADSVPLFVELILYTLSSGLSLVNYLVSLKVWLKALVSVITKSRVSVV